MNAVARNPADRVVVVGRDRVERDPAKTSRG